MCSCIMYGRNDLLWHPTLPWRHFFEHKTERAYLLVLDLPGTEQFLTYGPLP